VKIGVLNGPRLDLLGQRDPGHYGTLTLAELEARLSERADGLGADLSFFQSNHEGDIVEWVRSQSDHVDAWLVNAGALTHTSVPLREALAESARPFVEVHLSNVYAREPFRHQSVLADLAIGVIAGFHGSSYLYGLEALTAHLRERASG